jgi:hypothetical protein
LKQLLSAPIQEKEKYVRRQGLIRSLALLAAGVGLYLFRASGAVIMAVVLFSILYVVHVADRFSVKKLERAKGLANSSK